MVLVNACTTVIVNVCRIATIHVLLQYYSYDRARQLLARSLDHSMFGLPTVRPMNARFVGRFIVRTLDRSTAQSLDFSVAQSLDRSVAQSLKRLIGRRLHRTIVRSVDRSIGLALSHSTAQPLDWWIA